MIEPILDISNDEQYLVLGGMCGGDEPFNITFDTLFLSYCRDKQELELMIAALFDSHGNTINKEISDAIVRHCENHYTMGTMVHSEWGLDYDC